ncbi:hypothetical protein CNMCM6936_005658 [Aspergillus lentulus]|uniref:DUF6594 domain-containing protein n=1 Tax=Aspergillus lentulus TaxID=293939 RepID=A0AAN6BR22_ASPLE|nr:hypothetical protein CNMCM6936_005658 [Aspergillus lentulus]KAF4174172.1 hypothetical protein CNMCM8060_008992 [Aspergillus lentulus]KAF4192063.1 hypothetical protein CNMCM8694_000975 [Aspergillus lentulus]KAF4205786.1 hypothetical protein CNMCM8927_005672 [Aspergillus lentulus]
MARYLSTLLDLEKHFNELDSNDAGSDDMDIKDAARTWETFTQQCESGNKEAQVRKQMIVRLHAKLKDYHEALILQEGIMRLKQPNKRVLDAYRNWLLKSYPALGGQAKKALDISDDLVNLSTLPEVDILSSTLRRYWPVNEEFSRYAAVLVVFLNMADSTLLPSDEEITTGSEVEERRDKDDPKVEPSSAPRRARGRPANAGTAKAEATDASSKKKRGRPSKTAAIEEPEEM